MIRQIQAENALQWLESSRLGQVAVPKKVAGKANVKQAFSEGEVCERLATLGDSLGLNVFTGMSSQDNSEVLSEDPSSEESDIQESHVKGSNHSGRMTESGDLALDEVLSQVALRWYEGEECVAGFQFIASATSLHRLYSFADWLALQPKLKTPLYIVSVSALMDDLVAELHRPLFRSSKKSLAESCWIIDWEALSAEIDRLGDSAKYLRPEFLERLSISAESLHPSACAVE